MNISLLKDRMLPAVLTLALLLALLPQAALSAAAEDATTTFYRLDTGVSFLWKHANGVWQKGWEPGSTQSYGTVLSLPQNVKNVKVYRYDGGNFDFDNPAVCLWNPTAYATGRDSYNNNYNKYSADPLIVSGANSYIPANGTLTVSYTATFAKDKAIYVKDELAKGNKNYIYALLGSPTQEVIEAMNLLDPSSESYSPNVEGYLWFLPIVIQYDLTEEIEVADDLFDAILELPKTARVDETYTAKDVSEIGGDLTVRNAELMKRVKGESTAWSPVVTWPGKGKGQNTGGKKEEKASKPCEIEYRLVVTTTDGKTDEDIKTIRILTPDEKESEEEDEGTVDPDISLTAKLALPETVYEGHSVIAQDQSNYTVDGKSYSADAAYNQFGARHEFKPSADANAEVRGNYEGVYTDASVTWPKVGDYEVTLRISLKGNSDTDTKPIEVLKTPAIVDNLGGRQKQNRKQTLTASIATNPRYPLTNAWMEITEKATGETVRLRPGGALQNAEHIKTRAIEDADSNAYFTKLEFPFLTKWGDTRKFSYTIYAEDTRGQTDSVTKDFTVVPDLPPTPEILLPTTFFREKGTNVAKMEATDLSHSEESDPGDELKRTWYVSWPGAGSPAGGGFANAKTIAGYEELSFEEGKEIAFDKTGVGPVSVKIFLKDVWTDETLPEYVTDADYLTAESAVYDTVVSNIAPVVTLSPRAAKSADLLLLAAGSAEYNNLLVRKNEIDGALIEKGIDAKISIEKLSRLPSSASAFTQTRSNIVGNTLRTVAIDEDTFCVLSGTLDLVTNGSNSAAYVAPPYYITAYDAYSDDAKWSVQAPKALADLLGSDFAYKSGSALTIGQDDKGKYWYFVVDKNAMNRKSFLFDKTTGAHVKTFDYALGMYNYIEGNNIYSLQTDGIYKYKTSGSPERVFSGQTSGASALVGGKARFFTQASSYAYMADFDPVTEKTTMIRLSNIAQSNANVCAGLDNTGTMLLRTALGASFFDKSGRFVRSMSDSIPIKNGEGKLTYAASVQGFSSGRSGSTAALELTDLYTGASIRKTIQSSSADSIVVHPLYGFDNGNGTVHVQIGKSSNDLGSGWGDSYNHGPGTAGLCTVNTRTGETTYTAHSGYLGYDDGRAEYGFASDSLYATGWNLNSYNVPPPYDDTKHKVFSIPRNGDQILAQTTASLMANDAKDFKTVIVAEDSASEFDVSGAKFKAALGNTASVKLSDTGSVTLASAIVQRIVDAGPAALKTAVVQKTPGSDAGAIEKIFTLDPQKTYYYEYEANSADKAADQPLVISQETASALPGNDNMYVQDSYFEAFDGGPLTGFFNIDKAALDRNVLRNWEITFEVPRGVLGVLSFDFFLYRAGGPDSFAYLHSDGETVHRLESTRNGGYLFNWNGHYVHSVLLKEGRHTIASEVYIGSATIDNLKFETLVASTPESEAWSAKADDIGGGWTRYTGSFNTPRLTVSYAVQDGTHVYGEDQSYSGTKFTFSSAQDMRKIRNFSVWYLENGMKTYVEQDSLESASALAAWQTVNATAAIVDEKPTSEEKEKGALVYKKGELILYGIGYTDYENDPSKESFWRYTHTPFNDGEHEDAAVIMSKTGETLKVTNKVLPASIDRFYIDGKYVVEHWQRDNTDRTNAGNAAVNYLDYNKYSNTESITFYIEGGGEAPWVTGIRTNPDPVREGGGYRIEAGVDDLEKDDLNVLVEVYREGKKVYEYYQENVKADESGNYPTVVTGTAPNAAAGDYTVVVTVWDADGTGLGDHDFIVITEGRIEGEVLHTDLWEENRKRYNRKLFGEEVNRTSVFADYVGLAAPRPRGANVFWSGERFMLRAGVAGNPLSVSCAIDGYPAYATAMTNSGRKNAAEEWIYEGSVWKNDMINRWGRTAPVELTFVFTAHYEGGITKTHEARVIVDTYEDYRQLHRYY